MMALQLVHKKKSVSKAAPKKRKTNKMRFIEAIEVQLRIAGGEKVIKGTGLANSWIGDGKEYGIDKVMVPKVTNKKLYQKAVIAVKSKNGVAELKELRKMIESGKLIADVNALYRKAKT